MMNSLGILISPKRRILLSTAGGLAKSSSSTWFPVGATRRQNFKEPRSLSGGTSQAEIFNGNATPQKAALAALPPRKKFGLRRARDAQTGLHFLHLERSRKVMTVAHNVAANDGICSLSRVCR